MKLVVAEVQSAVEKLNRSSALLSQSLGFKAFASAPLFSQVSGLDQSGSMHGTIRTASEPEATKGLAEHFNNAVDLLTAQLVGYQMADNSFGDVLGKLGHSMMGNNFQAVINDVNVNHPMVNAFAATNPVAGRPLSLETLTAQLMATDNASMAGMSADWGNTASTIGEALAYIPAAIGDLSGSAETESIARAITHLGLVEAAGAQYMGNAGALAAHTASLVTVAEANSLQAAAALAVARATPSAPVAKAFEEAFLASFSPKLTTELVPVTPLFRQLLPELGSPNGAGVNASGELAPTPPPFENTPLPKIVQQGLANAGYRDLAYASTPTQVVEQFGRPNPDMLQSIAAGATPTQAASVGAPSMPPTLTPGGAPAMTGAGTTGVAPGIGQTGNMGAGTGAITTSPGTGMNGLSPVMAGAGGPGRGGAGAARGALNSANGLGNMRALGGGAGAGRLGGALGGAGMASPVGALGGAGANGMGASTGTGAGAGAGSGAAMGQAGNNAYVAGGQQGNGQGGARGMMAAGPGAYGAGQRGVHGGKRGKVQAVTSAVEREGNLKALLGDAPEVVPGVIGAWVREPRNYGR